MKRMAGLLLAWVMVPAGCTKATRDSGSPAASGLHVESMLEPQLDFAEVESKSETCTLVVDAWDSAKPGCIVGVNHCGVGGQKTACSLSEKVHLACAAQKDICGRPMVCDCHPGGPRPIPDAPDTIQARVGGEGTTWTKNGCKATQVKGAPPEPYNPAMCDFRVEQCSAGEPCETSTHSVACALRREVCGRTVHCACR